MSITKISIEEHIQIASTLKDMSGLIDVVGNKAVEALKNGNKILLAGNGGSAADSQHIAAELVGRFRKERQGLPAIALTTDTSIITAMANDYGYDRIFERQIEALAKEGDIFICISTSGKSPNLLLAALYAKKMGVYTVGLLGKSGGELKDNVDLPIIVKSNNTPRIQECHILIGHIVCEIIDSQFNAL
ncbi:MAG: D-sedoheptulose 7-phosphate isomerase [Candidatus Magnetoovum sp. WYHC-5]|nr:D-sedoheptulose 7-phosphate isomerase [Candidatus Magnetoovum sp. WYHC-5]